MTESVFFPLWTKACLVRMSSQQTRLCFRQDLFPCQCCLCITLFTIPAWIMTNFQAESWKICTCTEIWENILGEKKKKNWVEPQTSSTYLLCQTLGTRGFRPQNAGAGLSGRIWTSTNKPKHQQTQEKARTEKYDKADELKTRHLNRLRGII